MAAECSKRKESALGGILQRVAYQNQNSNNWQCIAYWWG